MLCGGGRPTIFLVRAAIKLLTGIAVVAFLFVPVLDDPPLATGAYVQDLRTAAYLVSIDKVAASYRAKGL